MRSIVIFLVVLVPFVYAAGTCGGNCASGTCSSCPCGETASPQSGTAPCSVAENLKCAESQWESGGESFKLWTTQCAKCGCCAASTTATTHSATTTTHATTAATHAATTAAATHTANTAGPSSSTYGAGIMERYAAAARMGGKGGVPNKQAAEKFEF